MMHIVMLRMGINERIEISSYGRVRVEIQEAKQNLLAISARNASRVVVIQCFPTNFHFLENDNPMESADSLCLFPKIKNMIIVLNVQCLEKEEQVYNNVNSATCRELSSKRKCNFYVPLSYCGKQGGTVQRAPSEKQFP